MKTIEEVEAARERFKRLAEEFKQYRNTTRLICWLRFRIQDRLLESGLEDDVTTGIYIGLLNSLYRLEQFEDILKEEKPEDRACIDLLSILRTIKSEPDIFNNEKVNTKL